MRLVEEFDDGTKWPYWVIFEHGHFRTPLVILDENDMNKLLAEYCASKMGITLKRFMELLVKVDSEWEEEDADES